MGSLCYCRIRRAATAQAAEAKCESLVRTGSNQEGQSLLRISASSLATLMRPNLQHLHAARVGGSETLADRAMTIPRLSCKPGVGNDWEDQ